jgi:succinoglycan biosynthesis transport protein ExoP
MTAIMENGWAGRMSRPSYGLPRDDFVGTVRTSVSNSGGLPTAVWRSRWILLLCVVLALGAGITYIELAVPIYTSTAKLYLDYGGIRISQPYEPGSVPQTDKYLYTQAGLLRSRPILAAAVEMLQQRGMGVFTGVGAPVAYLQNNLSVAVGKKDEIINISFDSPYPLEAAEIVNQVVDAYMVSRSQHERKNSSQVLQILQSEMTRTGKELEEKRNALETFQADKMPLALGSDQSSVVTQRYLDFQTALTQAEIAAQEAESFRKGVQSLAKNPGALRQYMQVKGGVSIPPGAATEKTSLETRLTELQSRQEMLLDTLTPGHPTVAALALEMDRVRARIAELDERFVAASLEAAEQHHSEATSYAEQLRKIYDDQRKQVTQLNAEIAQYQRLRSEVDQLLGYSQTLEQQIREIRKIVGEDVGRLKMEILEAALPAVSPSSPRKNKIITLALLFGLVLGGGIAVARDWIDQTIRSADEISAVFRLPVLGVVPAMSRRQSVPARGRRILLEPSSREAEAFRTVRTAVFFGAANGKAKTMLITSPASEDGKSTLVSNLAIAMARAGQKTLILDADLRKPIQHRIFALNHQERCLCSVLQRKMKLTKAIQPTQVPGLHLLTCGHSIDNPAEMLNSKDFARVLAYLGQVYDRVVVDAPPVTAVADAQILGALCDFTILVLRADRSTRRITQRAIDALRGVGGRLLGIVVNQVHGDGGRYGYYGRNYKSNGSDRHSDGNAKAHKTDAKGPLRPQAVALSAGASR